MQNLDAIKESDALVTIGAVALENMCDVEGTALASLYVLTTDENDRTRKRDKAHATVELLKLNTDMERFVNKSMAKHICNLSFVMLRTQLIGSRLRGGRFVSMPKSLRAILPKTLNLAL